MGALNPVDLRSLADLIERVNGDAFEIDAETRPAPPKWTTQGTWVTGLKEPRFAPWTIVEVIVATPSFDEDGRQIRQHVVHLKRSAEDLLFQPVFS